MRVKYSIKVKIIKKTPNFNKRAILLINQL